MKVRVKEGIALYNHRRKIKNAKIGKPPNYKKLNIQKVGIMLYGGDSSAAKYKSVAVSMHLMITGKATSIRLEFIQMLCETFGIDANFLLGFDSIHDKEFNKILN